MKIKNYLEFIKESSDNNETYDYGCVMLLININNWDELIDEIDPNDINEDAGGISKTPHITLKYGIHSDVKDQDIEKIIKSINKDDLHIEINGVDLFENKDFDVVKLNIVKNPSLQKIHDEFSTLPNSDEYKEYHPHITLAYVKKGSGKKYINSKYKYLVKSFNKIEYSKPNGDKKYYEI